MKKPRWSSASHKDSKRQNRGLNSGSLCALLLQCSYITWSRTSRAQSAKGKERPISKGRGRADSSPRRREMWHCTRSTRQDCGALALCAGSVPGSAGPRTKHFPPRSSQVNRGPGLGRTLRLCWLAPALEDTSLPRCCLQCDFWIQFKYHLIIPGRWQCW